MAQTKISALTAAGALTGTELVPIVQSGATKRTTTQAIANLFGGGGGTWGSITGTLSSQTDLQAALDLKENIYRVFDRKTGNYGLVLTDASKGIEMNVGSANTVTVPLNATQAFPLNTIIPIVQYGAGLTSVVATGGVTINTSAGNLDSPGQYSPMFLKKIAADEWYLWNGVPSSGSGTVTTVGFTGGLISVANPTTTPAFTVAGTSGGIPYFSSTSTWASSSLLVANALMVGGGAGAAPSTVTTGTGVLTALGIAVGSTGAFLTSVSTDGTLSGDGTAGNPLSVVTTGFVIASNNGSDFSNVATTRQNLRVSADILTITTFTGNRTLAATDFPVGNGGKFTEFEATDSSPQTLTVPNNATVPLDIGSVIYGRVMGTSTLTFAAGAGVTIQSTSGTLTGPQKPFLWSLTKDAADHWILDNSGVALGTANQILGVDNAGTGQEYKTVSNGLTSASGTLKFGGALTADTGLTGAFSFGLGTASPAAKHHVIGLGTTTGELIRWADNTPTTRLSMLDNGSTSWVTAVSGASALGNQWSTTVTATANSQTQTGYLFNMSTVDGGFTGLTRNTFEVTLNASATRLFSIGTVSLTTNGLSTVDFKTSGTQIVRNSTGILSLRGAGTSGFLQFTASTTTSTNAAIGFDFTGNLFNISSGSGLTRAFTILKVSGALLSTNANTITLTGFDYNPDVSAINGSTLTHYAWLIQSGLTGIRTATPTAFLHIGAGTATANTAPLKFTSGTNLTTAEAGAMEYNGTNLFFTRAGTTRENVLVAVDNAAAPGTSVGAAVVNFYGSAATNFLGDPNRWMSINILGTVYKVPMYT